MNRSSVERGFFRSTSLKKFKTTIQKNQSTSQDDVFIKPDASLVAGRRPGSYDKLNEQGFVPEEVEIDNGDIIIGKVSPIQPVGNSKKMFKDNSEPYKEKIPGVIDKVWTKIYNHEGYEIRRVRTRSERTPVIGDKVCLTEDHDVLTDSGWLPINKVTMNHKVATLVDGNLKYDYPLDTIELDYNGFMYDLKSQQVDLKVTMDHKMYVRFADNDQFELVRADSVVGKQVYYKKNAVNDCPDSGYEFNGTLEDSIWDASQLEIRRVLNKVFPNGHTVFTESKSIADSIQRLCIHGGVSANITRGNSGYCVEMVLEDEYLIDDTLCRSELVHFDGKVYCLEVPSHVFMVRRNDKPVWTGNCSRHCLISVKKHPVKTVRC